MPTVMSESKEQNILLRIWNSFQENTRTNQFREGPIPDVEDVFRYFNGTSKYKVIDLSRLSENDKLFLKTSKLSYSYLKANCSDVGPASTCPRFKWQFNDFIERLKGKLTGLYRKGRFRLDNVNDSLPKLNDAVVEAEYKTRFQNRMVEEGFIRAVCPRTGRMLKSNKSFAFDPLKWTGTVAYRFIGEEVFYLFTHTAGRCFEKLCIYIPKQELIILLSFLSVFPVENEIDAFKAHFVRDRESILKYIHNKGKAKKVLLVSYNHFAHHLWNELTGLYRLYEAGKLSEIDKFLVLAEPLAPIDRIFPEIEVDKIERVNSNMEYKGIERDIFDHNDFIIRAGDNFIKEGLADRIRYATQSQCSSNLCAEVDKAKNERYPLIWISLRLSNRTWISQKKGLLAILNELANNYIKPGIVFDGVSIPYRATAGYIRWLGKEVDAQKAFLEEMKKEIPSNIQVIDTIGCMMYESICWSYAVDMYIAHLGSLQHKIGWVANKPGIIHCNQKCASTGRQHPTFWARENGIEPYLIYGNPVQEVEVLPVNGDRRDNINNYEVDWRDIYQTTIRILSRVKNPR